jgi:carbamoyl-phosphate synthase/aspartate carbamoyltransferase/dihydroorotase
VRPRLGSPLDRQALWDHLDIIDCFATDHAPHTLDEKDGDDPPPGFPGLETALPLLLTAVHEGMLTVDDVVQRLHHRPAEIFGLPTSAETWVEVDVDEEFEIADSGHSRVTSVAIRGVTAYEHDQVIAVAGAGCDVRSEGRHTA